MPAWLLPAALAGASFVGGVLSNRSNAREAARNRQFQERMSSTAHQREVGDLRAAGINPMARHMSGASSPSGDRAEVRDPVGSAVQAGLAAKQMQANISLTQAQANLVRAQENDLMQKFNAGSFEKYQSEAQMATLSLQQQRELFPQLLAKAKAEVESLVGSARAANAAAALDELAKEGATNEADWERRVGELSPGMRALLNLIRVMRR